MASLPGLAERVQAALDAHAVRSMERLATAGRRGGGLNIAKLDDAELAGTAKGGACTLIVTEGDSAKALAVAGLEVVGRETFGIFPVRGKPSPPISAAPPAYRLHLTRDYLAVQVRGKPPNVREMSVDEMEAQLKEVRPPAISRDLALTSPLIYRKAHHCRHHHVLLRRRATSAAGAQGQGRGRARPWRRAARDDGSDASSGAAGLLLTSPSPPPPPPASSPPPPLPSPTSSSLTYLLLPSPPPPLPSFSSCPCSPARGTPRAAPRVPSCATAG